MIDSRQKLKEYALKGLGKPILKIEVAEEQLQDRLDEALELFGEYHMDGIEQTWVAVKLTQDDIDGGYITLPDDYYTVESIMNMSHVLEGEPKFGYEYQSIVNSLDYGGSVDLASYALTMQHIQMTINTLSTEPTYEFTRYMNKLKIYRGVENMNVGDAIAIKVSRIIDPENYVKIYNDRWLKRYVTSLFKWQWGNNLRKHSNIQMLGGVTMNGKELLSEAKEELEKLETQLDVEFTEPVGFIIG